MKRNSGWSIFPFKKVKPRWLIFPTVFLLGVVTFLVTVNNISTETYDIERFSIATETIRSPISLEDEQETKRKIRETVQSVVDRYDIHNEITIEQISYANEIFDAISTLDNENGEAESTEEENQTTGQESVRKLKELLSKEITENISDETLLQLMQIPKREREIGLHFLLRNLEETFNNGVRTENLQTAKAKIGESIKNSTLYEDLKEPLQNLSEFLVVENSFFDVEQTMEARKEAASRVEPVMITAGEVIVHEGQTITDEIYDNLELVGVLDGQRNVLPIIGLALLIILLCSVLVFEMNLLDRNNKLNQAKIITVIIVSILSIVLMKIVSLFIQEYSQLFYLVPIATSALLLKLLINERIAFILSIFYAIIGSLIFNHEIVGYLNVEAGIYLLFSQVAAVYFLTNVKDRTTILMSCFGVGVVNLTVVLSFLFLSIEKYALQDLFIQSILALISSLLSVVLTIGLLPFFETILNMISDVKLLQLSNPSHPLLKKILTEAPGTYHHSIMVANLSETACEAVGANGLLARVGAYYHDIGKTTKPNYFVENQLSTRNPHDFIDPIMSAKIIISHPYDGAEYLRKYQFPKEIIDIAMQHHGTSLLKYFYFKEKDNNKHVKESDFRYPGPKPASKEAAIICICDSVEAAVRSLKEPTEEKIENLVSSIINDRMMDNQLDESPLTLKELKVVQNTICETLKGIFHSRIQYPMEEDK
ncbi:HD family phosphohydrolase [Oceanobacillus senegalensis]|uniref:HD family phosphohydrolase n=1 Tax=Oceanobacillus senegalensis TaxID=1936063 RepID=UPI000A304AE4|nr:HDIG domain-containing metalloprotein [Oceanobacillus senegalensis]